MKDKRGFEFSFVWIFAIVIGSVIIILAIYGVSKIIGNERNIQESTIAKEIGIILNPLETGVEEGKSSRILFSSNTKLFNNCDSNYGTFGLQDLSVSADIGIGTGKNSGEASSFRNKYIFSSKEIEGKEYIVFSKPFKFPFKVGDLIFMWSENQKYCLINPPREIEEEIESLNLKGVSIVSNENDCEKDSFEIRIIVPGNILQGRVIKGFDEVYYSGSTLLYGAIFADPDIYECQVKRLMKRASELSLLYRAKEVYLSNKQSCGSNLEFDLQKFANDSFSLERSFDLAELNVLSENIRRKNNDLYCKIF